MWETRMFPILIWMAFVPFADLQSIDDVVNKCLCYEEMENEAQYQQDFEEIRNKIEPSSSYEYLGIKYFSQTRKNTCTCTDVTRAVATLTFTEVATYNEAKKSAGRAGHINNIITHLRGNMMDDTVNKKLLNVKCSYVSSDDESKKVKYEVEFIMKTLDDALPAAINDAVQLQTDDDGDLHVPNVGKVESPGLKTKVVECSEDPEAPGTHGQRDWNDKKLPGTVVTYSCDNGYTFSKNVKNDGISECTHNLKWTNTNIKCVPGCSEDPPDAKFYMIREWDLDKAYYVGAKSVYKCMEDYWPILRKDHISTCKNNRKWSDLPVDYECDKISCPLEDIPQTPAFGKVNWNNKTVVHTPITYYCIEGYSPTVKGNLTIVCQSNGTWSTLLQGFKCNNTVSLLKEGFIEYYDFYDNMPAPDVNYNWLLLVTVPSVAAIAAFILLCLCLTRTDRFLYVLCGCCREAEEPFLPRP